MSLLNFVVAVAKGIVSSADSDSAIAPVSSFGEMLSNIASNVADEYKALEERDSKK